MPLRTLSPELAKKAEDEVNEDPQRIEKDLQTIKEWIAKQPHLSARTDDQWLIGFLRGCKYSLEKTKQKLDMFYTVRTAVPELCLPRDPKDPIVQEILSLGTCVPLPKTVKPDDPRVILVRPGLNDPNKINIMDIMAVNQMISYIQLLEDDQSVIAGQLVLLDFSKTKMGHLTQMTPSVVKKMVICGQESMPFREKGSHHIHTLPGIETIFNLFKLFMNEKSRSRIHIHNEDMEALYKFIPKEILPTEYGGAAGPIQDMIDHWKKEVEDHRDWFLEDKNFMSDEKKRIGKPKTAETIFGIEGSFRQLTVD
ncbi:retinol-binding protein pinta-like [Arctopsyche grandis]|uniref:retinol-binding protein pinta-like n=1 Tax=Arctopsyche grandis TaxID=121162 RepID=UPI00406D8313